MQRKNKIIAVALAIFVAVAAAGSSWWYFPIYATQNHVRSVLKDPDSARFEKVGYNRVTKTGCGFVNAKNGMGGYVGFRHFTAPAKGDVTFEPNDDSSRGSTQEQLNAAQARLAYLQAAQAACPADD